MGTRRQPPVTRFLLVAALVLASVWAGAPAAGPSGAGADGRMTMAAARPGAEAVVLRDRAPTLGAPADRPGPGRPLLPVLLGLLVTALGTAAAARAPESPWPLTRARSLPGRARLHARAPPPLLQSV
ncbi:MAG TPA: hypothetical protein VJB61_12170 [Actinomycetota bacterium]